MKHDYDELIEEVEEVIEEVEETMCFPHIAFGSGTFRWTEHGWDA